MQHPMQHPIAYMVMDLLEADLRHDKARAAEIHEALLTRGWRVTIERCEPPRPVREEQVQVPVMGGDPSLAQTMAALLNRKPQHRGPGAC